MIEFCADLLSADLLMQTSWHTFLFKMLDIVKFFLIILCIFQKEKVFLNKLNIVLIEVSTIYTVIWILCLFMRIHVYQ